MEIGTGKHDPRGRAFYLALGSDKAKTFDRGFFLRPFCLHIVKGKIKRERISLDCFIPVDKRSDSTLSASTSNVRAESVVCK